MSPMIRQSATTPPAAPPAIAATFVFFPCAGMEVAAPEVKVLGGPVEDGVEVGAEVVVAGLEMNAVLWSGLAMDAARRSEAGQPFCLHGSD